ncbi:MAG: MlaD family protein [Actinomycetota bacterium]|nr:MlaD family protein [Actinomycetota bacterium]
MQRAQLTRLSALAALALAAAVVIFLLLSSSSTYVLHAEFYDAGQLVRGDLVTVAGHQVGTVGSVSLARDGLASIELDISDPGITPVRRGTVARIGQLSLTGVANRFVALQPGPGPAIPGGGTIAVTQTHGIVDLDVVLDSLTPPVRAQLQRILKSGAYLVSSPAAAQFNRASPYFNPAFSQLTGLASEVVADRFALARLLTSTAQITRALGARSPDLGGAVSNTAVALRRVAAERAALEDAISRSPGVLRQGTRVLAHTNTTLHVLDPVLRDLRPVAPRVATLLRRVLPATQAAIPTLAGVQALLPGARRALAQFPSVERRATPAVRALATALPPLTPILAGLRPYIPDAVSGFFNGVGGATAASYDANGHYLKSELTVQGGGGSLSGLLGLLGASTGSLGPFHGGRTGLLAPCPGGGTPAAPDASNPWIVPDVLKATGNVCKATDNQR